MGQLEASDGSTVDGNQEKANLLNNYFASVFQNEKSNPFLHFDNRQFVKEINIINVTEETISKATDRIKSTKSQGPDYIHSMLITEKMPY